jgi:Rrf2 family nitric oxide-sensitive transcriptional repressor
MRLTQWTDYTLRVLMYCAASLERPEPVTITEIAESHGISRSHLTKIVQELAARGWLETTRGRGGGMRLLVSAKDINLGEVVRATETDFAMVECFDAMLNQCRLSQYCKLKSVLNQATQNYLAVLDDVTLADLVAPFASRSGMSNAQRLHLIPGIPGSSN